MLIPRPLNCNSQDLHSLELDFNFIPGLISYFRISFCEFLENAMIKAKLMNAERGRSSRVF